MKLKNSLIALFATLVMLTAASATLACACCAERGMYSNLTSSLDTYQSDLLKDMKFGGTADLYMTAGEFEDIRGIADIESENFEKKFDIVDAYTNNTWRIDIKTPNGLSGTLVLPRPAKISVIKIDTHEKSESQGEISVYKEFQFKGSVRTGSGIFRKGTMSPATYQLIFQGRGNVCDNAEDFTHWRLEVNGAKAKYAFFGPMKTAG